MQVKLIIWTVYFSESGKILRICANITFEYQKSYSFEKEKHSYPNITGYFHVQCGYTNWNHEISSEDNCH